MSSNMNSVEDARNVIDGWWISYNAMYTNTSDVVQDGDRVIVHVVDTGDGVWERSRIEPVGQEDRLDYDLPDRRIGEREVLAEATIDRTRMGRVGSSERRRAKLLRDVQVRDRRPRS